MSDYSELNAKADGAIAELVDLYQDWPADGDYFDCQSGPEFEYLCAANPVVIKALIAENERLAAILAQQKSRRADDDECLTLATQSIDELRKDAKRYRWLREQDDFQIALHEGERLDRVIDTAMGKGEKG